MQESVLFLLAHQDDEFACAAHIGRELREGSRVYVVYLTNGSADGSKTAIRDLESRRALRRLGVREPDIAFLGSESGIADGSLYRELERAFALLRDRAAAIPNLARLYLMAWEGGHHDHDAAHLVGLRLGRDRGLLAGTRQFPAYNGAGRPWKLFRVFRPLPANGACERRRLAVREVWSNFLLCLCFPSQWRTWLGLLGPVALSLATRPFELAQPVSLTAVLAPPHPGRLLYERMFGVSQSEFRRKTAAFIDSLRQERR